MLSGGSRWAQGVLDPLIARRPFFSNSFLFARAAIVRWAFILITWRAYMGVVGPKVCSLVHTACLEALIARRVCGELDAHGDPGWWRCSDTSFAGKGVKAAAGGAATMDPSLVTV